VLQTPTRGVLSWDGRYAVIMICLRRHALNKFPPACSKAALTAYAA